MSAETKLLRTIEGISYFFFFKISALTRLFRIEFLNINLMLSKLSEYWVFSDESRVFEIVWKKITKFIHIN